MIQVSPETHRHQRDHRSGYVFISYKREDTIHARRLRQALLDARFEVWWDEDIQCGQAWSQVLDDGIRGAGSIVVLWSNTSMHSRWVMHEASAAIARGVYVPVRIELCAIDAPYDRLQASDILGLGWKITPSGDRGSCRSS